MSDEQKQQGVDLSGEYDVEQPKEAQPKAKTAVPAAVAQTPENGVDLSQDYEVGGKAPKVAAKQTADTAQPKTISEHPYRDILTHPWESVKNAADYYTRPDEQPKEKPQANPEGAAPQLKVPAPAGLPSAAKLPSIPMEAVNPISGVPNKPLPKSFTERPIPSLPTDEQITAAHQKMIQKGTEAGKQLGHMWVEGAVNQQGPGGGYYTPAAVEHPKTSEEVQKEHPIAYGVAGGIGGFAGGTVADPVNWALALSGGAEVPVLTKLASAAFSAKMGKDTLDGIKQLRANWDKLNEEQRSEEITKLGLSGLFAEEAGRHALSGTVTPGSAAANAFAGRDTTGESALPTVPSAADVKKVATAPVRAAARGLRPILPALKYGVGYGLGAGAMEALHLPHEYIGGIVGAHVANSLIPNARIDAALENGTTIGLSEPEKNAVHLENKYRTAAKEAKDTQAEVDKYKASIEEGVVNLPKDVETANDKAQRAAAEARYHADTARAAVNAARGAKVNAPEASPTPEPEITALKPLGEKKPPLQQINVPPTVSPAHAATTIPQEPVEAPRMPTGRVELANNQGTVGTPRLLTEGTPEVAKAPVPEEKPTVAPKATKPERGNLRDLKVDETGKVVEKDPEGERLRQLLIDSLKPETLKATPAAEAPAEKAPEYKGEERRETERKPLMSPVEIEEAMKNRKPVHTPFDVTQGAMETIKRDQAMPKHPAEEAAVKEQPVLPKEEPTGYAAKKEEVIPAGAEGREPVKSAAEYSPAVEQKVNELSDANLRKLAQAHGLEPNEYDLNARDERRHRVERDQLAKDIVQQMGEDEKINLGRAAASAEKEGMFQGADTSAKGRAARAEKMFPRLRGPVDENGNPRVSGGAPETVGTKEAADKDTEHFANAKKELGPNASISAVAKRAQGLKDAHAQSVVHNENGGSTFHPTKGSLNGKEAFAVGGEPEFNNPDLKMTTEGKELTPAQLDEFANRTAVKEALDKHKDSSIGTWYDKETGKTTTELVKTPTDRAEAIAMGQKNGEKAIYDLGKGEEIKIVGTGEDSFPDKIERPTTTTPKGAKSLPTGDALIKKYGEAKENDPKGVSFILDDGRKVSNSGTDHDVMLGGKATQVNPPRERFVAEGNIRVRPHQGTKGREVSFSVPESGVNAKQWSVIKGMSPQLSSGAVLIEVGKPGGKYEVIPYGEASTDRIEQVLTKLGEKKKPGFKKIQ